MVESVLVGILEARRSGNGEDKQGRSEARKKAKSSNSGDNAWERGSDWM
jgi:hypothetical protein